MTEFEITKSTQKQADRWTKDNSYETREGTFIPTPYQIDRVKAIDDRFMDFIFNHSMIPSENRLVDMQSNHLTKWFLIKRI